MSVRTARFSNTLTRLISVWGLLILLVLLIVVFSAVLPTFLTPFTFQSLLTSRSINALAALAVMLPLCANQYDLSIASQLSLAQVLANGLQTQQHLPWVPVCLFIIAGGGIVGLVNGILVTRLHINSFIATLGTGTLLLGVNQWYTDGHQIVGRLPPGFVAISGRLAGTGIPMPVVYVVVLAIALWLLLEYVPLGRYLYVIGDNPRAAELTGISVSSITVLAFTASGLISAFAGVVMQAQLLAGQSTIGQELMLPAFTGALLGATSVRPGRPNVWGTVLAVAVLAVAVAGFSQLGAPFYIESLFNGLMLVVAVGLAVAAQRRRERRQIEDRTAAVVAANESSSPAH